MLSKRIVAAAALTGVAASLPVIAAGAASAHTVSAAPAAVQAVAPAQVQEAAPAAAPQAATPATYTVVSGDWLSKIATTLNVQGGWQKLYDLNKNVLAQGPNLIFPGQKLVLGETTAAPAAAAPAAKPAAPAAPAPAAKPAAPAAKPAPQAPAAKPAPQAPAAKPAPQAPAAKPATGATVAYTGGSIQALAASIVPADQFAAFSQIISHESGWNVHATNPSSGAYGLAQALPGSKMASAGSDWQNNPATQIKWALDYMNSRYGSPNAAWAFWQTHHWY